jgi:hypothetical protein
MAIDFKPSEIQLLTPPLTATMGRSEIEFAAALMVWTCAQSGDAWRAVSGVEIRELITKAIDTKAEPVFDWIRNPFLRPDFHGLQERGFASREVINDLDYIAFTEKGFEALRRWRR